MKIQSSSNTEEDGLLSHCLDIELERILKKPLVNSINKWLETRIIISLVNVPPEQMTSRHNKSKHKLRCELDSLAMKDCQLILPRKME